ncbi:MAG: hypothetical protein JWO05_828 [Gemmatimonadetes bacterium]|nr:hypothetical protein [Gemmatimonadota bacterium]
MAASASVVLRIVIERPPAGATWRLQSGKADLVAPVTATAKKLVFEFPIQVSESGPVVFRGPFAQGPPAGRFIYVTSRGRSTEAGAPWGRRAKVHLASITREMVDSGATLEARFEGTDRKGGPACATVPLLGGGWTVARPTR